MVWSRLQGARGRPHTNGGTTRLGHSTWWSTAALLGIEPGGRGRQSAARSALARAPAVPPGDDSELAALLLTAADLPPGWSPFAVGAPPTADAGTNLDDPCVALLHRFDSAYEQPHAVAGFLSGSLGALAEVVFRLDSAEAATELAEAHLADIAGCPNVTGADGRGHDVRAARRSGLRRHERGVSR